MKYLKIKDWPRWQKWKPGKRTQAWIQVWRNLFSNEDWLSLSDAEKGQLVSMWIAAADKDGQLPKDPEIVRKMSFLDTAPDLNKFHNLGFIEGNLLENSAENDPKTLSKKRKHNITKNKIKDTLLGKPNVPSEIIQYFNEKAGRKFKLTADKKTQINARINEGFKIEDFKKVIDIKIKEWANDPKMSKYLRPYTLFGTKMDSYLNTKEVAKPDYIALLEK